MIKITSLSFKYPISTRNVLDKVSLEIPPGTLTLVTGASGSGKSTLLRCMNGLVPHFSGGEISGQILVFGLNPVQVGVEGMANTVGFVFQEPEAQFIFDTVEDEIIFSLENRGIPSKEMNQHINEVLLNLNLLNLRHKEINQISGGEQQKVAIASALVTHPSLLILDEPTSQLDPLTADEVLKFIVNLKTQLNLTILISEHRLERLLPYADLLINLTPEGKLNIGEPQHILPTMEQAPPIIEIAQKLSISPLPLTPEAFPHLSQNRIPSINSLYQTTSNKEHKILLSIQQLTTRIGNQLILKEVSLDIREGEILVMMGPNGAGKTTLLRSILKMIPSSGTMMLDGVSLENLSFPEIIQNIAYLPQNPNDLLFAESINDELRITLKNHGRDFDETKFPAYLDHFGLSKKMHQYPRDLSVGERQRTALAAITVHDPRIIFLDEPTRGIDYQAKRALINLFYQWRDRGKALLLVTHDVEFAAQLADRVTIIEEGEFSFIGSPDIAFTAFPVYQTQTSRIFPGRGWITPEDVNIILPA